MITKEYLLNELATRIKGIKPGVETTTDLVVGEMKSILVLVEALQDDEKKYNEALERASRIKDNNTVATPQEVAEFIFPELRESEDDRIRKAIVHLLEVRSEAYLVQETGFKKEQFLSYLEKQKEQKPAKWSEEDEKMIANLRSTLANIAVRGLIKKETEQKYSAWLKSIRPQLKQEWSEEDEVLRQDCIQFIETGWTDNGKSHLIPWLKSLRSRPKSSDNWKPSKEQMEALMHGLRILPEGENNDILLSLYEQLKKL